MDGRASKAGGAARGSSIRSLAQAERGGVEAGRAGFMIRHGIDAVIDLGHRRGRVTGLVRLILSVPEVGLELRAGP